jgi:hypothetical protein
MCTDGHLTTPYYAARDIGQEETVSHPFAEVVELSLLLPARCVAALEGAAHRQGWTTGQLFRRLVEDFLRHARRAGGKIDSEKGGRK